MADGFRIEHLERGYMRGPKAMTFMAAGVAQHVATQRYTALAPGRFKNFWKD
jgi:hypothetical protein